MLRLPHHVPLTGGDYFIHAIDRRMRRAGMPGNVCRIAVRLEGPFDIGALRSRVMRSPLFSWLGRVRMIRPCPVLPALWRAGRAAGDLVKEHIAEAGAPADLDGLPATVWQRDFHAGRRPAFGFDVVRHSPEVLQLVISWNHALMDVRGAELLLRHLQAGNNGDGPGVADLLDVRQTGFNLWQHWRGYPQMILRARGSLAVVDATCGEPLFSWVPEKQPAAGCQHRHRVVTFTPEDTARIDAHCERLNAGLRRSLFHLAATIHAVHKVARGRGQPGAYLVPVPHDMRRRSVGGPIFSNQLSFFFFRIEPRFAEDTASILSELTRQMMDQVRNRTPESFWAAMEMFKPMPLDFYIHRLGRPTRGKFASFFFSDAGETCAGIEELAGARLTGVTHLAPASRPPGLTVVFSRFRDQLSAVFAWVDDCLDAEEVNQLEAGLRTALRGEAAP